MKDEFDLYWPGTKIIKTRHNAFNWQGKPSVITNSAEFKMSSASKKQMAGAASDGRTKSITIAKRK